MTAEIHIQNRDRRFPKERTGVVIKDKMNKTRVVEITRLLAHPLYGKVMRRRNRYKAHDENNQSKIGDKVRIVETRPISKDKRWRIAEILK
jgi:small subunit ribosomal protein S17